MSIKTDLIESTCGELSCDECNSQRIAAARALAELERENIRLREALEAVSITAGIALRVNDQVEARSKWLPPSIL